MVPSPAPKQLIFENASIEADSSEGFVSVWDAVSVHPLSSVTVTI